MSHWADGDQAGGKAGAQNPQSRDQAIAAKGLSGSGGKLPHLEKLQRAFGTEHDLSGVSSHIGGSALDATSELRADGFATGEKVAFGQDPDLFLAAHEAAHVLQQRAGAQLPGGVGEEGDTHEQLADAIAARVVAGESAADLLPRPGGSAAGSGAVQMKKATTPKPAPAKAGPTKEQQEAEAKAQADAVALAAALGTAPGTANMPEVMRIINQPADQLKLVRTAYEKKPPPGSGGFSKDVLSHITADQRSPVIKQLTRIGAADFNELTPADRKDAAIHDGGKDAALGEGDEVLDDNNRVIAVFPATGDGVVQAAFYELHRGDKRSLQEIMADQTGAKTDRGKSAAIEAGSSNRDPKTVPTIGHRTQSVKGKDGKTAKVSSSIGPIEVYQRVGGQAPGVAWCGCFATFVYARAGIQVPTLSWSLNVPNVMAGVGDEKNPGAYYQVTSAPNAHRKKGDPANTSKLRTGQHTAADREGVGNQTYKDSEISSLASLDIRPGDVMWQQHSPTEGHVGVIVGVNRSADTITCVTIEGNASNMLMSHVRTITRSKDGKVTSGFKGWGRPPELNTGGAPPGQPAGQPGGQTPGQPGAQQGDGGDGEMPAWMKAAQGKPKTGNGSTR